MAGISFEAPIEGELTLSGRPILVLGVFESGKAAIVLEDGEFRVTDDPMRLFIPGWPLESANSLDTESQDPEDAAR